MRGEGLDTHLKYIEPRDKDKYRPSRLSFQRLFSEFSLRVWKAKLAHEGPHFQVFSWYGVHCAIQSTTVYFRTGTCMESLPAGVESQM